MFGTISDNGIIENMQNTESWNIKVTYGNLISKVTPPLVVWENKES